MNNAVRIKLAIVCFWMGIIAIFLYGSLPIVWVRDRLFGAPNVLNVYTFTDTIAASLVSAFEQETGIVVRLQFFENNEELFAKLAINNGRGADIVVLTDYMIPAYVGKKLLKPLDHARLKSFQDLDTRLLNLATDPLNRYTVPVSWTTYGYAYRKEFFADKPLPTSWSAVFDHPAYTIVVPNDVRDMVFFAGLYLFGKTSDFSSLELQQIQELLIMQKSWVDSYLTDRGLYAVEAGVVPLAVMFASAARRLVQEDDSIGFVLPTEGSMMIVEHMALSSGCLADDAAYQFINFLQQATVAAENALLNGYNPVVRAAYEIVDAAIPNNIQFCPRGVVFESLRLLSSTIPAKQLERIWLKVKTA